jgi:RNA-directed DNA polymerase
VETWLKAGVMTNGEYTPTESGTPQGGVISPLLMNIALHGLEEAITNVSRTSRDKPQMVRYADDLVVFHSTLETIVEVKIRVEDWLRDMGLELKASKTRITHTLTCYEGNIGFEFLGFSIRHYPVGKTHSGTNSHGTPLGFKTIIKPSKEAVKRHLVQIKESIHTHRSSEDGQTTTKQSALRLNTVDVTSFSNNSSGGGQHAGTRTKTSTGLGDDTGRKEKDNTASSQRPNSMISENIVQRLSGDT